ncbi:MAG: CRISPR-associated endonuclease Cas2 [Cyclobacteriaceae bacterium]
MICWVLYDIQDNKARRNVAKYCKQAGLYRVQYSCFLGTLNGHEKDTLELQIEQEIDEEVDKVYLFPMNKSELQSCILMGQAFDKKLVSDEVRALFL